MLPICLAGAFGTFATLLINLTPDEGAKVTLAVICGLLLGIPWLLKSLQGIAAGLIAGVMVAFVVTLADASLATATYPQQILVMNCVKWLVPIGIYAADFGIPLFEEA